MGGVEFVDLLSYCHLSDSSRSAANQAVIELGTCCKNALLPHMYYVTHARTQLFGVSLLLSLGTTALMACLSGCRLHVRYTCRARWHDKKNILYYRPF